MLAGRVTRVVLLLLVAGCSAQSSAPGPAGAAGAGGDADVGLDARAEGATHDATAPTDAGRETTGRDGAASDADAGKRPPPGAKLGSFKLTYYWVTAESDFTGPADTTIYDDQCNVLATVPAKFASSLDIEGTGRLSDGRVINVTGSCSCPRSPCYAPVDAQHPWGYGVQNRALVPFRSVAVDKSVIAYGTKLYIPELDGVSMPGSAPWGGFVHDGCVSADDTGGGIVGQHVDFFSALKAYYLTLDGKLGLSSVTVYQGGARCP